MKSFGLIFLALFTFNSTVFASIDLAKVYPESKGVYAVKGAKQQKAIQKILEDVDVAFEMGDGYYDVRSVKLYIVRDGSKVIGYLEAYVLYYTEDPELAYAWVRYDVNGKRVGDLE